MLGNDIVLCIVGNKIDLEKDRRVPNQIAEDYAKSVNAKLYHTSAKLSKGIDEVFNDLANRKCLNYMSINSIVLLRLLGMLERLPAAPANDSNTRAPGVTLQPTATGNANDEKKPGSCC